MEMEMEVLAAEPRPAASPRPAGAIVATPAQLLQIAVERGTDLAYVEKLMELQERFEANAARAAHNVAFAAFKAEAITIVKGKLIKDGPLKGKKHADLFDVVSAVTPALSKHGLSISWALTKDDKDWLEVTCYLKHSSGHVESVSMGGAPDTGPGRNAIQARCSVKTYLERYTATAILGMAATDDDDDGAGGAGGTPPKTTAAPSALLAAAKKSADRGLETYAAFWSALTADERKSIGQAQHKVYKAAAEAADAARTVDADDDGVVTEADE